jgi:HAD superfamily phosphoserine phosphatase-like hydrolase
LKLAIVDYDGTLFKEETIPFLIGFAKNKKIPKADYYKALFKIYYVVLKYKSGIDKNFGKEKFHHEAAKAFLTIFKNMKKNEIEDFFQEASVEAEKLFNEKILMELARLKGEGYQLVLLSGGFLPYVSIVGRKLKFDKIFATDLEFLDKGFNLNKEMKFITGINKKETILKNFPEDMDVDWQSSFAYADSYFDSDVLELTGNPHAVNPDSRLRKYAKEKGWPIIN